MAIVLSSRIFELRGRIRIKCIFRFFAGISRHIFSIRSCWPISSPRVERFLPLSAAFSLLRAYLSCHPRIALEQLHKAYHVVHQIHHPDLHPGSQQSYRAHEMPAHRIPRANTASPNSRVSTVPGTSLTSSPRPGLGTKPENVNGFTCMFWYFRSRRSTGNRRFTAFSAAFIPALNPL